MSRSQKRIVSLLPSATEIVCALGLEQNLVGVTHECDFPETVRSLPHLTASKISHETMTSAEIDHEVRSNLDGHGSIYDLDEEKLSALRPDVIITQELCEVCAVSYSTVKDAARIYASNAAVVSLEPNSIEDIFSTIMVIGELCDASESAENLIADLRNRINELKNRSSGISERDRKRVFMLEWLEPPFAPGHWVPEQVELAGGLCLMGKPGKKSVSTTLDAIIESDPEILVMIPCGYEIPDIFRQIRNTVFPLDFQQMKAFTENNIWAMNASAYFSRPAPRVVDGAEILSQVLNPELMGHPDERAARQIDRHLLQFS